MNTYSLSTGNPRFHRVLTIAGLLAMLALLPTMAGAGGGAVAAYTAYLDTDNNTATGCTVMTVDGPFNGVEERLVTTVDATDMVSAVDRATCTDPGTDTFGPPTPVDTPFAPPWAVGLGNGTDGADVIETYTPLTCSVLRMAFTVSNLAGGEDAMLTRDGQGGGGAITLLCGSGPTIIPTLSPWALAALAALLTTAAGLLLRHRRRSAAVSLMVIALLATGALGVAWAAGMLDGQIDDWMGIPAVAMDPIGDGPPNADLRAGFALLNGDLLCLRFDAYSNAPPIAEDDAFTTAADTAFNGDVLAANGGPADSDPDGDPLSIIAIDGNAGNVGMSISLPSGALLDAGADGLFAYDPNGAFDSVSLGSTAQDTFTYTLSDGNGGTDDATVTITIQGLNEPPDAVDDSFSILVDGILSGANLFEANNGPADSDPNGDPLTVIAVNGNAAAVGTVFMLPSGALVQVDADGGCEYDPNGAFNPMGMPEMDTFTYTITDGNGGTDTATVTITINQVGG